MNTKQKMLLPPAVTVVVLGVLGILMIRADLRSMTDLYERNLAGHEAKRISELTEVLSEQSLRLASLFAELPEALEAFTIAHSGDINDPESEQAQEARELLRRELSAGLKGYEQFIGTKFKLHYHLPNGRSLVRLWRDKQVRINGEWKDLTDDISSFRNTVLDVNSDGKPRKGIELGRGGFVVRGLCPVKSADGRVLGSVETLTDFNSIMESDATGERLLYMNAEYRDITRRLHDTEKYPVLEDAFVRVVGAEKSGIEELVSLDFLEQGKSDLVYKEVDNSLLVAMPVKDYKGKQIGVYILVEDITPILNKAAGTGMKFIGLFLLLLILVGTAVYFTSVYYMRKLGAEPEVLVSLAQNLAKGDLDTQLPERPISGSICEAMGHMAAAERDAAEVAETLSQGDFRIQVEPRSEKDTLLLSMRTLRDNLSGFLAEVEHSARLVETQSHELRSGSESLSQGSANQASSLQQLTSIIQEINKSSGQNAEKASSALDYTAEAGKAARQGSTGMESMVEAMREINESSRSIAKIIQVIDEIAFQTNLLALNAAVEAARAGKHGKGFAVVAEEVRNLAGRSAKAAQETSGLIKSAVEKVNNGNTLAQEAETALSRILEASEQVSRLMEDIAAASQQQAQGVQEVNEGVKQVDAVTHQSAAEAEQTASAANELANQARNLLASLSHFKLNEAGNTRE